MLGATYYGAQREVGALFDTQLEQSARVASRTLLGLPASSEPDELVQNQGDTDNQYQKNMVIQVWADSGELLLHSDNAPLEPLSNLKVGFENTTIDERRWRVFSFYDEQNNLTIKTGEPIQPRRSLIQHVVRQTVIPVLIGLPLVTLLIWLVVSRGLSPLNRLASDLHARNPKNLSKIDAPYAPAEVQPLIEELNGLLERLTAHMRKEHNFIGNAAHELRTPLSGLKAQAEVALGARDDDESQRALNNILLGVNRANHMVNQLLTLSRIDETNKQVDKTIVNIDDCIKRVLQDLYPASQERSIELTYERSSQSEVVAVSGLADGLYVLFRNLIDNAIKYSPLGASITVESSTRNGRVLVAVIDQGPGIPDAEHERVFDRFHRQNNSDQYGSGLGLSIVRQVLELHDGFIQFSAPKTGEGLIATISLPVSAPVSSIHFNKIPTKAPKTESNFSIQTSNTGGVT